MGPLYTIKISKKKNVFTEPEAKANIFYMLLVVLESLVGISHDWNCTEQ